jgi:hypothetical protein
MKFTSTEGTNNTLIGLLSAPIGSGMGSAVGSGGSVGVAAGAQATKRIEVTIRVAITVYNIFFLNIFYSFSLLNK